jgi:hypothetical protein
MSDSLPVEIRCRSRILGIIQNDGTMEIKCSSSKCGASRGVVVFHYVDLQTGRVVETKKYRDPQSKFTNRQKETK